jgi:Ca2+-binding RTX toxin-like protein
MNFFDGSAGRDKLRGRKGIDVAFFLTSKFRVRVDLRTGSARGSGLDRLIGVEAVVGSEHDDALAGNRRPNDLIGGPGSDRIGGGGGGDLCFGEAFQSCESANYEDPPALNSSLPSPPEGAGPPTPPSAPGPSLTP